VSSATLPLSDYQRGKVTITGELGADEQFDCFLGDGKLVFCKPGSFAPSSFAFDINNDGTLQTPLAAIKKMGN
jgi:hypothetical protein